MKAMPLGNLSRVGLLMRIALTVVAGFFAVGAADAQVDTSEWQCEFCPFASGYEAEIDAGAAYVSDDALRFGNGSGYDESGSYLGLGGEGHYLTDGYQLNWIAEDLGLDSRIVAIDGGRQGRFGFTLAYSELPYRRFGSTSTVYLSNSRDALSLPANWNGATQTSGFTALATSLRAIDIASDRKHFDFGGHYLLSSNIRLSADYRRIERDGIDIVSGSNYTQASLLPRLLDFETDLIDVGLGYSSGPLNLSIGWFGSFFRNKAISLTWDNAFNPTPQTEQRQLAVEPDNDFQQLTLSGNYRFDAMHTVLSFSASMGRGTQDDAMLPYTINPNISTGARPRDSLGGEVDTANYALTLTSNPLPKARIKVAYRFDDRDNQTARSQWSRVITDTYPSGETEFNTPYSFDRTRLSVNGDYSLFQRLRVSAGYDRTELNRDFQEVAEQTEDSGWGRIRWRPTDWLDINTKGGSSKRDIDRYDTSIAISAGQNPLLRKYNLAYRYRQFAETRISLNVPEKPVSIGVSALFADDSYSQSTLGLTDSDTTHYSVDLDWVISDQASIYVFGASEDIDANQSGSELSTTPGWFVTHKDEFRTVGGGIVLRRLTETTDLSLDYLHTDGQTAISLLRVGSSRSQFPDLESSQDSLRLKVTYRQSDRLDIDLRLRYESFETKDWALAGVGPDTIPTILSLGAAPYDYDVWVVGVSARYRFGEHAGSAP